MVQLVQFMVSGVVFHSLSQPQPAPYLGLDIRENLERNVSAVLARGCYYLWQRCQLTPRVMQGQFLGEERAWGEQLFAAFLPSSLPGA